VVVEVAFAVQHTAFVVLALRIVVQQVVVLLLGLVVVEPMAVQQDNAVLNMAIAVPVQNTVVAMVASILAMAYVAARVAQRDHVVPHLAFVETLRLIAEGIVMATVFTVVVALVSAAHNLDIVAPMVPIALSPNSCPESSQFRLKVNSKDKRRIITRLWPVQTIVHVVQVEPVH